MPVNLQTFTDFATDHTIHVAKNIHVHEADGQMEVGSASFKQTLGRDLKANQRTMAAFRSCLSERYGVFGEHAFDAVLGARADVGKTLRAKDIASVMRALSPTDTGTVRQTMIAARFANEAQHEAVCLRGVEGFAALFAHQRRHVFDQIPAPVIFLYTGHPLFFQHPLAVEALVHAPTWYSAGR